jgi:hypothetical protein
MSAVPFEASGEVQYGAHRLRLSGAGSVDGWSTAAAVLSQRIADSRYWSAWSPPSLLDVVAAEVGPDGATIYMAGSIAEWQALAASQVGIPALEAAGRALAAGGGRLDRAVCQSRGLEVADRDPSAAVSAWPWPVQVSGRDITIVRPIGTFSRCQLDALATAAMAAVHAISDRYDQGRSVATVVADHVQLAEPVSADSILHMIYVWEQLCWVDLLGVELNLRAGLVRDG